MSLGADQSKPSERELALSAHARRVAFHRRIAEAAEDLKKQKLEAARAVKSPAPPVSCEIAPEAVAAETDPPVFCPHCLALLSGAAPAVLTIRDIKRAVSAEFGLKASDLASPRRQAVPVIARQVAMSLAKELLWRRSYQEIGREFGDRDHTTVMHAFRALPTKMERDPELAERVSRIRSVLAPVSAQ